MEKKGTRSGQPASKGLVADSKKNQDGTGGKLWPRGGRRREPSSSTSESARKPNPQRNTKTFDNKRPRARGAFNPGPPANRTETARLEEQYEAELGSVFVPGSKKQSLNHLLNFNYGTHNTDHQSERAPNNTNRLMLTRKHKYNKENFLQANCQFVVNTAGDYKQYMNNPDALVDWGLIEQVNVQVAEFPSCPICLYAPVAAKMTRCGHIYCWSCILHYLSLSDKAWRKCPICYESIHVQDLKSVVSVPHNTFNINDVITFKLMRRPKGSLIAYPATMAIKDGAVIYHLSELEASEVYTKLLLANQAEVLAVIGREEGELRKQLEENVGCPENCFVDQALVLLDERRGRVGGVEVVEVNGEEEDVNQSFVELDISGSSMQPKFHYFYQASDGQHIYLHAINARMLEHTYGSLEFGPKTLNGRILEKEGGSMTEELRKRLRYLQHLPVTCQFEVAEIHLKQPHVNKETLDYFNEQVEIRRKRRQRRARDEKRREKRIEQEENRLMGKYPIPNLHIESQAQFPCFEPRLRTESECTQPSDGFSSDGVSGTPSSSLTENDYGGPSFATMLASAKKREVSKWPTLAGSGAAPAKLINVTGQKMSGALARLRTRSDSEPEHEIEQEFMPPCNNTSLGDAIVQALQKAEGNDNEVPDVLLSGKKKKKKNKQKVLFTTTMAYCGK